MFIIQVPYGMRSMESIPHLDRGGLRSMREQAINRVRAPADVRRISCL